MSSEQKLKGHEDEFFHREDEELIRQLRARLDEERAEREARQHFMKCPKCGADLAERTWQNVSIDVCTRCRGTWLDAGELEMLTYVRRSHLSRFIGNLLGMSHP